MKEITLSGLKCIIKYPTNFSQDEKNPLIIFLHGAGSRGDTTEKLVTNPFFLLTEKFESFPFVVLAPLCSENTWFDSFEKLKNLVIEAEKLPFVDASRIYLVGASMGGYATWQLAMSMPEHFAAILPICGGGMYWNAGRLAKLPVWAFHGAKDTVVFPEESQKWLMQLINRVVTQNSPSTPNVTTILGQTPTQIPKFLLGFWNTKRQKLLSKKINTTIQESLDDVK